MDSPAALTVFHCLFFVHGKNLPLGYHQELSMLVNDRREINDNFYILVPMGYPSYPKWSMLGCSGVGVKRRRT